MKKNPKRIHGKIEKKNNTAQIKYHGRVRKKHKNNENRERKGGGRIDINIHLHYTCIDDAKNTQKLR